MRIFLADLGHNLLTFSTDVYPLGVANLATWVDRHLQGDVRPEITIFREPQDLKRALDLDPPEILGFSNYSRFYAGLSQIMIALIFFQVTAVAIILGAELNRGLIELKKVRNGNGSLLNKDGDKDGGAVAT